MRYRLEIYILAFALFLVPLKFAFDVIPQATMAYLLQHSPLCIEGNGAAVLFRLNKPLTLAATFINNPLLQPLLVATSIGLGHLMLNGHYQVITESPFTAHGFTMET